MPWYIWLPILLFLLLCLPALSTLRPYTVFQLTPLHPLSDHQDIQIVARKILGTLSAKLSTFTLINPSADVAYDLYPDCFHREVDFQFRFDFNFADSKLYSYSPFPKGKWVARLSAAIDGKNTTHREMFYGDFGNSTPIHAVLSLLFELEKERLTNEGIQDLGAALLRIYGDKMQDILQKLREEDKRR